MTKFKVGDAVKVISKPDLTGEILCKNPAMPDSWVVELDQSHKIGDSVVWQITVHTSDLERQ